jgi:hypothetical protein
MAEPPEFDAIQNYMLSLIAFQRAVPSRGGKLDWQAIAEGCGIQPSRMGKLRSLIEPGLDAIGRWHNARGDVSAPHPTVDARDTSKPRAQRKTRPVSSAPLDPHSRTHGESAGRKKRIVEEFPMALFGDEEDLPSFQEAFRFQMRRHGETYWHLHDAVTAAGIQIESTTLLDWSTGKRVPRSVNSFAALSFIERRYRLQAEYFKAKLPNPTQATYGHQIEGMSASEQRRIAWHLPDDFNTLPFEKREEIIEWVRRVIIRGSTDYRLYHAAAIRQRYAIRFPGISYGGRGTTTVPIAGRHSNADEDDTVIEDPDLLAGVVDAPPQLSMEMADLIRFKTSTLSALGFQRNGVWGEETASQKIEHLGLMFGALAASPNSEVRGYGVPLRHLTFGLFIFPGIWDWYIQWRERRRGFYTAWEVDMLSIALALTRQETGWLRQHPELLKRVQPIPGLVSREEIVAATEDWHGACEAFHKFALARSKEIERVAKVHRDPFEPIMPVLESDSPVMEYRKITEEILTRMPDKVRYPKPAAEAVRGFLLLRLGLHLGLRQKNLRQLLLCPRGHFPTSVRRLEDMKRGEIRWSDKDHGWEVVIPSIAFKNSNSSFFGSKPFRLVLPDFRDLYKHIEDYVDVHRGVLLGGAQDPGTFFVKTVKASSRDAACDQTTFYEAWRLVIQRYGIYNPYTGRGAIAGLLPHGPHNVRDVLATHILKQTGSYEQASYAIQDTPDVVAKHYGRFLPQDKSALAAKILNQVWQAA